MKQNRRKIAWRIFSITIISLLIFSGWLGDMDLSQPAAKNAQAAAKKSAGAKAGHHWGPGAFLVSCRNYFCVFNAGGGRRDKKSCAQSDKITVKIINKGAAAGTERKIQKLLAIQEQLTVTIGNRSGSAVDQSSVFFREEKFREEAQSIAQLLREKEKIFSYARIATTVEEKSADIVIILGKYKEAPPN